MEIAVLAGIGMIPFLLYFIFDVLVGLYAKSKGRSFLGFFIISLLLTPLVGFIIALVVRNEKKHTQEMAELREAIIENKNTEG